jgi:DNA polymerase-3 subunit gamma/tau
MSYLVLARKYRPRDFGAMVGQEHVVQALANALEQRRLHHAYLFTGTRGVGKTTVSRILAKSLNCTGSDGQGDITAHPCGACPACRDIDAGRHVDYVELDAASNRSVEEITQLLDQAVYKPVMGRFKVYMIDEVHMLSNHAFNAMLKTLEEPPDYVKFVLATTDPQKVPPTVLSRCLQFNLRPMAASTVVDYLARVLGEEGVEADPGALHLLARAARGSMRDALSLTDQAIAHGGGRVDEAGVRGMLGAVDRGHALRMLDALAAADGPGLLQSVDGLRSLGLSAAGALEEMAQVLQQMAVSQVLPADAAGDDAEAAEAARLASLFAPDETALLYSMCLHGRAELALAPDEYGGLTMVLLRMLAFAPPERRAASAAAPATRPAVPLKAPQSAKAAVAVVPLTGAGPGGGRRADAAPTPTGEPVRQGEAVAVARPPANHASRPAQATPDATDSAQAGADARRDADAHRPVPPREAQGGPSPATAPADDLASAEADGPPAWLDAPEAEGRIDASAPDAAASADSAARTTGSMADPGAERFQPTPLGERWAAVVDGLLAEGRITALTRELAWQAQCVAHAQSDGGTEWQLRVEREMLRAPAHVERLRAALEAAAGAAVRLEVVGGRTTDTPALRASAERERRQRAAEASIAEDPLVRSLLAEYKTARIVPGSVQPC